MNKRIKELALEAFQPINSMASEGVADYYTFEQTWFQLYNQKFAELIVEECIVIMNREIDEEESKEKNRTISDMMDLLEKHFGVEE